MITLDALKRFAPGGREDVLAAIANPPDEVAAAGLLDNPLRLQHWLARNAHESLGFTRMEESGWYSADRLRAVFPRYFTPAQARAYAKKPQAILSRAYANRMGNGPERSGDGWRYRGRGIIGLTGRSNYRHYGKRLRAPLEDSPDLAADPVNAVRIAALFWDDMKLNLWADRDDALAVARGINLGDPRSGAWPNGLADQKQWLAKAKALRIGAGAPPKEPAPLDDGKLSLGDEGEAVAALQRALKEAGYPVGTIDGIYGEMTRGAVILAQDRLGLGKSGEWDPADTAKLAAPEAIAVPEKRRETTEPDLREQGDKTIGLITRLKSVFSWLGFGGVVSGAAASSAPDLIGAFTTAWAPLAAMIDFIAKNPWALWGAAALAMYGALSWVSRRYVDGYRAGQNMGDGA